jgi:hypothetical protein
MRMNDWFDEQGIYVIEMGRILKNFNKKDSHLAEWEGIWKGLDGKIYLLECKFRMRLVYSSIRFISDCRKILQPNLNGSIRQLPPSVCHVRKLVCS